eukprot:m.71757 g.71757  ORF g.71757 m.71757 type:complete len:185 (+) comp12273_c0_seq1:306-860(+)
MAKSKDKTSKTAAKQKTVKAGKSSAASKPKPKMTMKKAILKLTKDAGDAVSLHYIKKKLPEFGFAENSGFNKMVLKNVKALAAENRPDFFQWGGKYSYKKDCPSKVEKEAQEKKEAELKERTDNGEIQCPWCEEWVSGDCFVDEDSIARGGIFECSECSKTFYSWISDGYTIGRKVEYKYSKHY